MDDHMQAGVDNLWMLSADEWEAIVPYGDSLSRGIYEEMPLFGRHDEAPLPPAEPLMSMPRHEVVDDVSQGARDHSKRGYCPPRPSQMTRDRQSSIRPRQS